VTQKKSILECINTDCFRHPQEMNLLKKLKKVITFKFKKKPSEDSDKQLPFYNCEQEIVMSYSETVNTTTQTERTICPTCESLPEKETLALKQIRINQKLDETTSDAIVLPYYSLVPPFRSYDENQQDDKPGSTEREFSNRTYIGVMSNKKGKSAIKKLYLSVYGTVEYVDRDGDIVVLKPLADYDKDNKLKKPIVSGLELLVAASNLLKEEKESLLEEGKGYILGKRLIDVLLGKVNTYLFYQGKERLEGFPCSFVKENTACYDEHLNRIRIEDMVGKLVVGIVDYCLYDGGEETKLGIHFVRILGNEERQKVTEVVQKYYYG
jgi:hypothetical protein